LPQQVLCYAEDYGAVKSPGTHHGWMLNGAPADETQFDRKNNATAASNTAAVALDSLSDLVLVSSPTGQLTTSERGSSVPLQIQLKFQPQVLWNKLAGVFFCQLLHACNLALLATFWSSHTSQLRSKWC